MNGKLDGAIVCGHGMPGGFRNQTFVARDAYAVADAMIRARQDGA